jgi:hypothetical protein
METIIGSSWYGVEDIARVLEISIEQAQAIIERCIEDGRVAISHYPDAVHPAINGFTLRQIAGQRQPTPYMPTGRMRRR